MKKLMTSLACVLILCVLSCQKTEKPDIDQKPFAVQDSASLVKKGEYLVTITGCNDCHTPKKMGPTIKINSEKIHSSVTNNCQVQKRNRIFYKVVQNSSIIQSTNSKSRKSRLLGLNIKIICLK